jgi:hypothetical protein
MVRLAELVVDFLCPERVEVRHVAGSTNSLLHRVRYSYSSVKRTSSHFHPAILRFISIMGFGPINAVGQMSPQLSFS